MERLAMEAQNREEFTLLEPTESDRPKNQLNRHKKVLKSTLNSSNEKEDKKSKKKQKLYCVCQTPYDKAR